MTFDESLLPAAHLGDGVYVHFDGMHLVLQVPATANGDGLDQRIHLDPSVFARLVSYAEQVRDAVRAQNYQKTMQ